MTKYLHRACSLSPSLCRKKRRKKASDEENEDGSEQENDRSEVEKTKRHSCRLPSKARAAADIALESDIAQLQVSFDQLHRHLLLYPRSCMIL